MLLPGIWPQYLLHTAVDARILSNADEAKAQLDPMPLITHPPPRLLLRKAPRCETGCRR